ncbi:MAG: AraC family transcriptional regulator [Alphaproteobacteria bacterium 16-39-46]|nr:MAG: AraC family transcriptional regulator [Alphaproteobacteria bacterium 16-39-46]OZA43673.1 MAG: AraC family transcriptional regulator [Alphaproteobacteria bacterium 17-39-52]HQS83729.1 DJ-1/PfpI family protein [Alphaproteobacteria bacterium]HQS93512.1 DJ-1/PfpI family protein [Alphaproteobacteria bacterium]
MLISILTFQGYNELDSFIAFGILNRIKKPDWHVNICCPEEYVTSWNGLTVKAQSRFEDIEKSDAVVVGSGALTRDVVRNSELMEMIKLNPSKQLITAQCSGALILAKLGVLGKIPVCTDLTTKPWVQEAGVEVLNQPFYAENNIATAGGCFSAQYLAAWVIAKTEGVKAASEALHYVAPVGEKEAYVMRAMANIEKFLS